MALRPNPPVANMMDASEDDDESYVDVMNLDNLGDKTLMLTLTPKNHSIGIRSEVKSDLICATIKACTLPEEKERTPVDIVVALDISSSMNGGDKLGLCKLTIEQLLRNLLPYDRFGLITYSDDAVIKSPLQFMTAKNKQNVSSTVKNVRASGSTNISAAIALSFQELQSVASPNKIRSIFLLTDGNANCGITDQEGLTELTRSCWNDAKNSNHDVALLKDDVDSTTLKNSKPSFFRPFSTTKKDITTSAPSNEITTSSQQDSLPVSLFCFGYGSDHNAPMLRNISDVTETGSYYFVQTDSDVSSAFGDALGGLVSIVAQSAVLTLIPPSKEVQILRVYHDSAIRREDASVYGKGATYTVSLGDFYAEETRDVLIEVSLDSTAASNGEKEYVLAHLLATLSYTDILKKTPIRSPQPIVCSIERPDSDEVSNDDEYVAKQWIRVYATKEMEEAEKLAQLGRFVEAKQRLQAAQDLIAKADINIRNDGTVDQLVKDLLELMNGCTSRSEYYSNGSKQFAVHQQTYKKQRMSTADALTMSPFRSAMKRDMAVQFREQTAAKKEEP